MKKLIEDYIKKTDSDKIVWKLEGRDSKSGSSGCIVTYRSSNNKTFFMQEFLGEVGFKLYDTGADPSTFYSEEWDVRDASQGVRLREAIERQAFRGVPDND
jgi:hypothetical protein